MERKNIDAKVASEWKINMNEALNPFWRIIFPSFNRGKNKTISTLSSEFWIQIVDLKRLPGLKKTRMVMYSISSKLKSAFSMIGKTTVDKLTSKLVGKSSRFRFRVNN